MNYHNLRKLNRDPKRSKKRAKRLRRNELRDNPENPTVTAHWLYNHAVARLPHSWLKKVFGKDT